MEFATLRLGSTIEGHARVVASSVERSKTGDAFWRLTLADRSGNQVPCVFWGRDSSPPATGCVVRFRATARAFRETLSLTLTLCERDEGVDAGGFLPRLPPHRQIDPAELDTLIAEITDEPLRQLVETCFANGVREQFAVHPAAMKRHGAVIGGLLAHTVKVTRIALSLADVTVCPIDRSMMIAAALLHDIGKLDEQSPTPGEEPTEDGRLLGHIVPGVIRIMRASQIVLQLSDERRTEIVHAVLASHGKREFGSPAEPATLEAVLLHLADMSEASIEAPLTALEAAPLTAIWTDYVKSIDGRLRVPERRN
jgi:3'-5' exoribonuclease